MIGPGSSRRTFGAGAVLAAGLVILAFARRNRSSHSSDGPPTECDGGYRSTDYETGERLPAFFEDPTTRECSDAAGTVVIIQPALDECRVPIGGGNPVDMGRLPARIALAESLHDHLKGLEVSMQKRLEEAPSAWEELEEAREAWERGVELWLGVVRDVAPGTRRG